VTESANFQNDVPLETSIPGASLESIPCTQELRNRPSRSPEYEMENRALVALASALADSPRTILQTLAETILDVTRADSSGLSLLTTDDGGKRFYWPAIAGMWKPHIGGGTPRNFGPCGDVLDCNSTLLFRHFERRYTYFLPITPLVEECLLVPFYVGGKAVGTIWANMHDDSRKFDAEDERLMGVLGRFASLAYQTLLSVDDLKLQMSAREKAETELRELTNGLEAQVRARTEELEQRNKELTEARARLAEEKLSLERSEADLAEAQRLSHTGSWHLKMSTGDVVWSKEFFPIFGFDPDKTKPSYSLNLERIHPEDRHRVEELRSAAIREKRDFEVEYRILLPGGLIKYVHSIAHCLVGQSGDIEYIGAVMDITERKQAAEKLRRSETRNAAVLDSALDCIVTIDHESSITEFNPAAERTFGYRRDEVVGKHLADVIIPLSLREKHRQGFARYLATGEARVIGRHVEVTAVRADGSEFPVELAITRIPLDGPPSFTGYLRDITERKQAEEELRRSEAFLAEAQRLSLTGSFSWRFETEEFTWSEQLYRIFEFEQGVPISFELIGTRVHPEDIPLWNDILDQARRAVSDFDYEHRLLMPDHSVKYIHVVAHGSRAKDGRLEFVGAVQDVTQRRSSEEALARAQSELAHVARVTSLGALTASIAHEVSQPLLGIITNASTCLRMLAADPPNVDGARETARRTIRDGNRASDVITRLRALFSKKEATTESVDLNEATREVIALSLSELQRNRVILRTELADDLSLVTGDRVQLQQVVLNLLQNASDAMSGVDDRPRQLLIRTEREEVDRVRLSVQDAGVGLDPQAMDRLFEAFYTTKNDGMGMGLSVSRSIIERHRGCLWAAPNDGPGATFSFSIPCGPGSVTGARSLGVIRTSATKDAE
jgi:PAS domain S-box-containing protein